MSKEAVDRINALPGWVKEMGIVILTATTEEVTCEWEVREKHHQVYGIVHGGVHCGVVETLASIGAAMVAHPRGQNIVGVENNISFIRAVRSGTLRGLAKLVTRGRASQVWEVWIRGDKEQLVAQGRGVCSASTRIARSAERIASGVAGPYCDQSSDNGTARMRPFSGEDTVQSLVRQASNCRLTDRRIACRHPRAAIPEQLPRA